jgi:hypothetical protein
MKNEEKIFNNSSDLRGGYGRREKERRRERILEPEPNRWPDLIYDQRVNANETIRRILLQLVVAVAVVVAAVVAVGVVVVNIGLFSVQL